MIINSTWDSIPEQYKAKELLSKLHQERRVPHAFLFYGIEGIGKFFTAIHFAKLSNGFFDSSSKLDIAPKISNLQEPYIKLIIPLPRGKGESADDSATDKLSKESLEELSYQIQTKIKNPYHKISIEDANTIKISSIREIRKFISMSFDEIPFRFVIILDAHMMNDQAQNALLKSLEEPPEGIVFILITSEKNKLLPTIISRCREVDFQPLSKNAVENILVNYFEVDALTAKKVSPFSSGSALVAFNLVNYNLDLLLKKTISILRFSFAKKYHAAIKELQEFVSEDPIPSYRMLVQMIKIWLNVAQRNRFYFEEYSFADYQETFEKFNARYPNANLLKPFTTLDLLDSYIEKNLNLNVLFISLIFELASVVKRN